MEGSIVHSPEMCGGSMTIGTIKAVIIVGLVIGLFGLGYHTGSRRVQVKWDKAVVEAERQAAKEQFLKQERIHGIATKRVAKAAKDKAIDQSNSEKVDAYVSNTIPMLPGSLRVYHDAIATGQALSDRPRIDAAPVSAKDLAKTFGANYAECRYDQGRLEALQEIVKQLNGE
jgi:hypothetical protein